MTEFTHLPNSFSGSSIFSKKWNTLETSCTLACYDRRKTTRLTNSPPTTLRVMNGWRKYLGESTLDKVQRRASKCALGNIGRKTRPSKLLKNAQHLSKEDYFRLCRTINRPTGLDPSVVLGCTLFSALNS